MKTCVNCGSSYPLRLERPKSKFCSLKCRSSFTPEQKLKFIGWDVVPNGCWIWRGRSNWGGYGVIGHRHRAVLAHRTSWAANRGDIPFGIDVLHHCDVRLCINPDHLFLGTDADNIADMDAKGRRYVLRGEENGCSKLREEQIADILSRPRGYGTGVALAEEFGVSPSLISLIRLGKVWHHVQN